MALSLNIWKGWSTHVRTHTHREHFAEPARQNRSAILSGKHKTCGFTPAKPHEPFIFFHQIVSVRNWKTQGAVFTGCWNSQSRVRVDIPPCFNKQDSPKKLCWQRWNAQFFGVFKPLMRFASASASATEICCMRQSLGSNVQTKVHIFLWPSSSKTVRPEMHHQMHDPPNVVLMFPDV